MFAFRLSVALLFLAAVPAPASADPDSRVRISEARLAAVLLEGQSRSATLRDLIDRLQRSDVIVHVQSATPTQPIDGAMQFVGAVTLARYVRVTVRTDLAADQLMALLGHELMHAVEVAENAGIRDEESFRNYYDKRGRANHSGRQMTYDTRAAVEAGQRVAVELRMTHAFRTDR